MIPKVLIACPTSDKKDYCLDDWYENILKTEYPNYTILMVDNSHDETYHNKIQNMVTKYWNEDKQGTTQNYAAFRLTVFNIKI